MYLVIRSESPVKKFGKVLRQLREAKDWTQEDLAGELNVDRAYVSQLERGVKNPSLKTMAKLAKVFSVQIVFADAVLV
jgi:transcriptional regulator with XRE-family HTH domain